MNKKCDIYCYNKTRESNLSNIQYYTRDKEATDSQIFQICAVRYSRLPDWLTICQLDSNYGVNSNKSDIFFKSQNQPISNI